MAIPSKGWYVRKRKGEAATNGEVYFNGEMVERIRRLKVGLDAETALTTLELEIIGAPIVVDIVQEDVTELEPQVLPDPSDRKRLTGNEASKMLEAALQAEQYKEST